MKLADIPAKIPTPFGSAAGGSFIRPIPATSQIGIQDGAASWPTGFVPDNFLPVDAGGIPPFGEDMNGVLNAISAWAQWIGSGSPVPYDPVYSALEGGYPQGAFILAASGTHWWLSAVDDNVTDPDTGGAGWTQIGPFGNIMSLNIGANLYNDGHGNLASTGSADVYVAASQAIVSTGYLVDTTAAPVALTAPLPGALVKGMRFTFEDAAKTWGVNALTIDGNGTPIGTPLFGASAATITLKVSNLKFGMWFNGTYLELL